MAMAALRGTIPYKSHSLGIAACSQAGEVLEFLQQHHIRWSIICHPFSAFPRKYGCYWLAELSSRENRNNNRIGAMEFLVSTSSSVFVSTFSLFAFFLSGLLMLTSVELWTRCIVWATGDVYTLKECSVVPLQAKGQIKELLLFNSNV